MLKKSTLLTSSLLLLLSWGGSSVAAPKKPSAEVRKPTAVQEVQLPPTNRSVPQKPTFELISAGAESGRQVLRYKPVVNAKEMATMTMNMDMKIMFSGTTVPTKMPATVMKMETIVTKVDPNGDIHYQFRYLDADVQGEAGLPASIVSAMRSQMKKLNGLSGTFVISDRGQLKSSNFKIPKTVDETTRNVLEQMSQSLEQFSSALPIDAVGKGAKWRVVQPLTISGIRMVQTATYEIANFQQGGMILKTTLEQTANAQAVQQPGLPGMMQLKSMSATGQGETIVRFDRLLPPKASISISSKSEMEVKSSRQGTSTPISTDSTIESTFITQNSK